MTETVRMDVEELLVDPSRFAVRSVPVDEAQVDQLVLAIEAGETLRPLVVAPASDPLAAWYACPRHWVRQQRVAHAGRERDTPYSRLPLEPAAVLLDGVARYWAHRRAGAREVAVIVTPPVATPTEVLARALALNLRNSCQVDETGLRRTFERLWLGRPPKASHEHWAPTDEALPLNLVADLLGRSTAWCGAMIRYAKVTYRLGLDLGMRKSVALSRLPEEEWRRRVFDYQDRLKLYSPIDEYGGPRLTLAAVPDMSARELERMVEQVWLLDDDGDEFEAPSGPPGGRRPVEPAEPAPAVAVAEPPRAVYQGELPLDWSAEAERVREVARLRERLAPEQAYELCVALAGVVSELMPLWEGLRRQARRGGYDV